MTESYQPASPPRDGEVATPADADYALMALVLTEPDLCLTEIRRQSLGPDQMGSWRSADILRAATSLYDAGRAVDATSVAAWMRADSPAFMERGGDEYIEALLEVAASGRADHRNIAAYVDMVKDAHLKKSVSQRLRNGLRDLMGNTTGKSFLADLFHDLMDTARDAIAPDFIGLDEMARSYLPEIQDRMDNPRTVSGAYTPSSVLNGLTTGTQPREMWIVSGDPGCGKTSFTIDGSLVNVFRHGKTVHYCSAEMGPLEVFYKIIAAQWKFPMNVIRSGQISESRKEAVTQQWSEIKTALLSELDPGRLEKLRHFRFLDAVDKTVPEIEASVKMDIARTGWNTDLVVIDYAGLLKAHKGANRYEELSSIFMALKNMALRNSWPLWVITQLNDNGQVYGSRELNHHAHVHVRIGRDRNEDVFLNVEKNRMAGKAQIPVIFNGPLGIFHDRIES